MNSQFSTQAIDALASIYEEQGKAPPPEEHRVSYKPFRPSLNPTQAEVYDTQAKFILAHGEKGSGKTVGVLHKLVSHCRESFNALAIIITGVKRQAEEGGAWHKLLIEVLPEWKSGCGMIVDGPHGNIAKDTFVWVSNRFGGWSRILLLSMPVEGFLPDRFRGPEPTFVMVDEAQGLASDNYFKIIVMQVGRRKDVPLQQVAYCCNPDGPSHWLYKRFFIYPMATGKWDKRYAVFHVPVKENIKNLPPRYYEDNVLEACRGDDIEYRRMVLGEWVDAPTGEALFKDDYKDEIHGRGDFIKSIGFLPVKGVPITTGWDLGAAHTSLHFQQIIATKDRIRWLVFDEMNYVDQYLSYPRLVPKILDRLEFWKHLAKHDFQIEHVSDNSAFNQFRSTTGSFDVQDIEKLSGGKIRLKECPKGPHSVEARVRITKEKLQSVDVLISGSCPKTREMFMHLEMDKDNAMKPKRSRFLHPFDSLTYPHLYYNVRKVVPADQKKMEPQYYSVGA